MRVFFRWFFLLILISSLTGCFVWLRAYQTLLQMEEFDKYFTITASDEFSVHFKQPILFNDDFTSLSKLQPSLISPLESGEKWRYWFRKVDAEGKIIQPEIKFYFDLKFNKEYKLERWTFSPLFLQIAPAKFLELSLRSLGGASIDKGKRQLKANSDLVKKISTDLPKKATVLAHLGEPLSIKNKTKKDVYRYHFLLETDDIEEGYEERTLSVVKLSFDKKEEELYKMSGRFAGLKISIDYRKFLKNHKKH